MPSTLNNLWGRLATKDWSLDHFVGTTHQIETRVRREKVVPNTESIWDDSSSIQSSCNFIQKEQRPAATTQHLNHDHQGKESGEKEIIKILCLEIFRKKDEYAGWKSNPQFCWRCAETKERTGIRWAATPFLIFLISTHKNFCGLDYSSLYTCCAPLLLLFS